MMTKWRTQTGEVVAVTDMTTSHIKNSLEMLKRQAARYPGEQYYIGSSDYAADAVESKNRSNRERLNILMDAISSFEQELRRRTVTESED